MLHDYQKLNVWQQAHQWVLKIYACTRKFPDDERFGLTSQLRRAAASVPTNLAEGCGRKSPKDISHFIQISIGSSNETEYLLILARDLEYLNPATAQPLIEEAQVIRKQLLAFQKRIEGG